MLFPERLFSCSDEQTLTRGEMAVEDVLLLSDRMAGDDGLLKDIGASLEKASCCSGDRSHEVELVLQARQRAVEKVMFFAACAEQNSEHPIAKGASNLLVCKDISALILMASSIIILFDVSFH